MKAPATETANRKKRRRLKYHNCVCCKMTFPFCWTCRCGFSICQNCMLENMWGMTCNAITWTCPDCGGQNGFGNQ